MAPPFPSQPWGWDNPRRNSHPLALPLENIPEVVWSLESQGREPALRGLCGVSQGGPSTCQLVPTCPGLWVPWASPLTQAEPAPSFSSSIHFSAPNTSFSFYIFLHFYHFLVATGILSS